jgi:hypothetical protein
MMEARSDYISNCRNLRPFYPIPSGTLHGDSGTAYDANRGAESIYAGSPDSDSGECLRPAGRARCPAGQQDHGGLSGCRFALPARHEPTFLWRDPSPAAAWRIDVTFADGSPALRVQAAGDRMRVGEIDPRCVGPANELPALTPQQAAERTWKPDDATWGELKRRPVAGPATVAITGYTAAEPAPSPAAAWSCGRRPIRSERPYSTVPLIPSEVEKWRRH